VLSRTGLNILVVEDDADFANTLAEWLARDGHRVVIAEDGHAAIDLARRNTPDAVLLDVGLPDVDGYAVARSLRQGTLPRSSAIVILTGQPTNDPALDDQQLIDLHLTKPIECELLSGLIHFVREKRRPRSGFAELVTSDTWIETTAYREDNRTVWIIKLAGEVVKAGEVSDDPFGIKSFDVASKWARTNLQHVEFNWKHWNGSSPRGSDEDETS
jgi:DNA-binding response OmpR family regulator